eukprot:4046598-Amphidinium_carterae.2
MVVHPEHNIVIVNLFAEAFAMPNAPGTEPVKIKCLHQKARLGFESEFLSNTTENATYCARGKFCRINSPE